MSFRFAGNGSIAVVARHAIKRSKEVSVEGSNAYARELIEQAGALVAAAAQRFKGGAKYEVAGHFDVGGNGHLRIDVSRDLDYIVEESAEVATAPVAVSQR